MRHILIASGFIFSVVFVRSLILSGLNNDAAFLFLLMSACFVYGFFFRQLIKIRLLNGMIIAGLLSFLTLAVFIAVYGSADNVTFEEDAAIVLGCGLKGDQPSRALKLRLDKAVLYHRRNPDALIFVSGGQGANEIMPEAVVMERYLISEGVDAGKIIREENSLSTYENLKLSAPLIKKHLDAPFGVAVITSEYHIFRGVSFAKAEGLSVTHFHANSAWYAIPVNYARECAAVIKMRVIKK